MSDIWDCHLSMVHDSALYSNKKNKEQRAIHIAAECEMNKKMPGLIQGVGLTQ